MLSIPGGRSAHIPSRAPVAQWPAVPTRLALLAACACYSLAAGAAGPAPLTLVEAEKIALQAEPGQASLLARAQAMQAQSVSASQLPDPTLRVGLGNFPIESGGFSTEGMTQAQLGIRQAFPPGRSRTVSARRHQSSAQALSTRADARARDVLTAVRRAWLETWYWHQAHAIVSDSRPFFSDLVTVTRSLYGVGRKDRQDVLRAELELSRLDDRLLEIDRQQAAARAALSEWVAGEASRELDESLPDWDRLPAAGVLRDGLAVHPTVLAANAQIDAQQAGVELAKEHFKPGWAVDVGYGYRDGSLANGQPRSDFVSVSVSVDLPVFRANRQDRDLAAAVSERRAASASRDELLRRLASQLDGEYAHWQDLTRRLALYETRILDQAQEQASAALSAYQSEAGDFADVMRGRIDELNARLEHMRLQVERAQSYALLANLGGLTS